MHHKTFIKIFDILTESIESNLLYKEKVILNQSLVKITEQIAEVIDKENDKSLWKFIPYAPEKPGSWFWKSNETFKVHNNPIRFFEETPRINGWLCNEVYKSNFTTKKI